MNFLVSIPLVDDIEIQLNTLSYKEKIEGFNNAGIMQGAIAKNLKDNREHKKRGLTWEVFCQSELKNSRRYVDRQIAAYCIWLDIKTGPIGPDIMLIESQLRPLSELDPEQQQEAWQIVTETAPEGKITAVHVTKIVRQYFTDVQILRTAREIKKEKAKERQSERQEQALEILETQHPLWGKSYKLILNLYGSLLASLV